VLTREGADAKAAPIEQEVAVDAQGYFTIQNLEAGRNYQLLARAPDGDHLVAGVAWGRPPNPRVLIYMSEDYASTATPPIPPPPSWPSKDKTAPASGNSIAPASSPEKPASTGATPVRGVEIGTPIQSGSIQANPQIPHAALPGPDFVNIPGPRPSVPPILPPKSVPQPQGPYCSLRNNRLEDLTLKELNGNVWDYRRDHYGKLLLLVFWHTNCQPCKQAIPSLNSWQQMYGPALEVVAIAEEHSPRFEDKVEKINNAAKIYAQGGFKYRILVSDIASCPAQAQFQIRSYPTFILMDGTGHIILGREGLDPLLEQEIRGRLGVQ
jgi:thiol-disulfide isomerase/thioredoxin